MTGCNRRCLHVNASANAALPFLNVDNPRSLNDSLGHDMGDRLLYRIAARLTQPHLSVAVNVSARQFHHPQYTRHVQTILERTRAPVERITLELTESLLLVDIDDTISKKEQLRSLGVRFSLDDFGTGYSSLAYLERLPLDELKIDRSFVQEALIDANDAAIVRTIIVLAQTMGLHVIAEGVETEAVRTLLEESGCTAYQGCLFGRPLPASDFDAVLQDRME